MTSETMWGARLARHRLRWLTAWSRRLVPGGLLTLGLALTGCGGSHATVASALKTTPDAQTTSASERAGLARASAGEFKKHVSAPIVQVQSAARATDGTIRARYTCKGADISPPVTWTGVPAHAKELLVFVNTLQSGRTTLNWAVAGLSPSLHRLAAGKLPAGAIVGRNSFGKESYSLCPGAGAGAPLVAIGVVALLHPVSVAQGFPPGALNRAVSEPGVGLGSANMTVQR